MSRRPVDSSWFRFHHSLRDVLRAELAQRAPERCAELHAAAGRWCEASGELLDAVEHHPAADCLVKAAELVTNHATELLNVGRTYTVTRYLDRLGDLVDRHGGLAIVHGWVSFVTGRFSEAETSLATAMSLDVEGANDGLRPGPCSLSASPPVLSLPDRGDEARQQTVGASR